jgi:archaellum component FlaC
MTEDNHIENIRAIAELQTQVANVASDVSTVIRQLEQLWQLQNQVARLQQEQSDHRDTIKRLAGRVEDGERQAVLSEPQYQA